MEFQSSAPSGAWRSRNSKTYVLSTPVNDSEGTAASSDDCNLGLGYVFPAQRAVSAAGGRRQHSGFGHAEFLRYGVSRPLNHRAWAKGVPTLTE